MPIDKHAKCRALVALTDATAYLALQKDCNSFSNIGVTAS